MTVQRLAEPSDLDARIAVLLRVEIFPPAEAIDCDRIGFDKGATAGLGIYDDEPEHQLYYRRTSKGWRRFNSGQFLLYPCYYPLIHWTGVYLPHWHAPFFFSPNPF